MPIPGPEDLDQLEERTKESIEKTHHLVDEMKVVQEYENTILANDEPPLFHPEGRT
jgi:hypothetical protein